MKANGSQERKTRRQRQRRRKPRPSEEPRVGRAASSATALVLADATAWPAKSWASSMNEGRRQQQSSVAAHTRRRPVLSAGRVGLIVPKRFSVAASHPLACLPAAWRRGRWMDALISVLASRGRQQAASSCASNRPTRGLDTPSCASTTKEKPSCSAQSAKGNDNHSVHSSALEL